MKHLVKSAFAFTILAGLSGMSASAPAAAAPSPKADRQILNRALSMGVDLTRHPDAHSELRGHVEACGLGVVTGWSGENRCGYRITIDDLFLKPLAEKTGYIPEKDWDRREGVQFLTASQAEMDEVPEAWDLSDIGPMTDIHYQKCGDCWSTSSRKLLEQALATHGVTHADGSPVLISEQTTLSSCCTWCGSCNGGYMSTPDFFSRDGSSARGNGLPTRDLDPYQGRNSSCKFTATELREFEHKLVSAPYVGSSLEHSRFFKDVQNGPKVKNTMALMMKYKSNALATISAISQSGGIITSCSNINSGGNHMQNIVGWYQHEGKTIARVQNSWGASHGQNGYTHMLWECGEDRLNRGLGRSTRVGIFEAPGICTTLADAYTGPAVSFSRSSKGDSVVIGRPGKVNQTCEWLPKDGIIESVSADGCQVRVSPAQTTEYHVIARDSACGSELSAMVLVTPTSAEGAALSGSAILTPHGLVH